MSDPRSDHNLKEWNQSFEKRQQSPNEDISNEIKAYKNLPIGGQRNFVKNIDLSDNTLYGTAKNDMLSLEKYIEEVSPEDGQMAGSPPVMVEHKQSNKNS